MTRAAHRTLIVALSFGAVSAFGGAVLGVVANGAGVSLSYLDGTPFTSYLIPSLILGVLVGGTQGFAAIATQRQMDHSPIAAAVAGFGMIIWIFVELAIIGFDWLQVVYLAVGAAELILVLVLLGVLSAVTPVRLARRTNQPESP